MGTKAQTFDCVEMKNEAQRKLLAEYESRKEEFSSFVDFINAKGMESAWQREFWARVAAAHAATK
jgi:hypothetical protein